MYKYRIEFSFTKTLYEMIILAIDYDIKTNYQLMSLYSFIDTNYLIVTTHNMVTDRIININAVNQLEYTQSFIKLRNTIIETNENIFNNEDTLSPEDFFNNMNNEDLKHFKKCINKIKLIKIENDNYE